MIFSKKEAITSLLSHDDGEKVIKLTITDITGGFLPLFNGEWGLQKLTKGRGGEIFYKKGMGGNQRGRIL